MSGFSGEWLELREGADTRARDTALCTQLQALRPAGGSWRIVDLGCGTGANFRYLAPLLEHGQHWLLVDDDSNLLDQAAPALRAWSQAHGYSHSNLGQVEARIEARAFSATLRSQCTDLATGLDAVALDRFDLVTCSALLDLVSADWLGALAERCRQAGCVVYCTLSYDGRISWRPELPYDEQIRTRVNRHQHTDKGFGAAAGPDAVKVATHHFRSAGFSLLQARSDWRLHGADGDLQVALARGWGEAARVVDPARADEIGGWLDRRLANVSVGHSQLTVGHVDLLAVPPPPTSKNASRP